MEPFCQGSEPEGSPSSLDLDEDDEAAELAQLEGAQKVVDAAAKSGSAKAGMRGNRSESLPALMGAQCAK